MGAASEVPKFGKVVVCAFVEGRVGYTARYAQECWDSNCGIADVECDPVFVIVRNVANLPLYNSWRCGPWSESICSITIDGDLLATGNREHIDSGLVDPHVHCGFFHSHRDRLIGDNVGSSRVKWKGGLGVGLRV